MVPNIEFNNRNKFFVMTMYNYNIKLINLEDVIEQKIILSYTVLYTVYYQRFFY